jgi:predicted flap endonuclease-1-like 5' DNA nuclease
MASEGLIIGTVVAALAFLVLVLLVVLAAQSASRRRNARLEQAESGGVEFEAIEVVAAPTPQRAADAPGPWGPEVVVYDVPSVTRSYRAWGPTDQPKTMAYTFPRTVERAVYTNDYIPVDAGGTTLKMRTLLAGPPGAAALPLDPSHAEPARAKLGPEDVPEPYRSKLFPSASARPPSERYASGVPATGRSPDGQQFVQQLEERVQRGRAEPPAPLERAYYDYSGDVHPVEDIEGIGAIYGDKLRAAGIYTTARLCFEDAQAVADKVGVPLKTARQWQHMGELVKVKGIGPQYAEALARAGIDGIAALKRRAASGIANQVNAYLGSLEVNVIGTTVTEARVEGWKKAAEGMKRVRLKVPEQ